MGYYHQLLAAVLVHPDRKQVIPLFPEAITHQDGATKNDCEANASKRLLKQLHEAFPNWPLTAVSYTHLDVYKRQGLLSSIVIVLLIIIPIFL